MRPAAPALSNQEAARDALLSPRQRITRSHSVPPDAVQPDRKREAFPSTRHTWIGEQLREGDPGREIAVSHVIEVYAEPLKIYFRGCSLRFLGDADEMVNGFFADRLSRPDFLDRWQSSGRPLRFWLIVGFKHYLLEESRRIRKHQAPAELPDESPAQAAGPEADFDREVALALVRDALQRAERSCRDDGLDDHWDFFIRHHLEGTPYAELCRARDLTPGRAAVMVRTAANRFRKEIRALVGWESATENEVDGDIRALMENLAR